MNKEFFEKIEQAAGRDNVKYNEPMSSHTTFKTGGPATVMVTPADEKAALVIRTDVAEVFAGL